jgi:inhibitor of cysteine peptidase
MKHNGTLISVILACILAGLIVFSTIFCGCLYEKSNSITENSNVLDNNMNSGFKVVHGSKELFNEYLVRLKFHNGDYNDNNNVFYSDMTNTINTFNTFNGYKTASKQVNYIGTEESSTYSAGTMDSNIERYSKTNVQVNGIDEADIVKTDGKYIYFTPPGSYHILKNYPNYPHSFGVEKTYIIKALPPEYAHIVNNITTGGYLYLVNDSLIIIDYNNNEILSYNISNPKYPKLKWKMDLNGSYVDSRVYGGKLYLIASKFDYIDCPIFWNGAKIDYDDYYIPIVSDSVLNNFDRTYIISEIDPHNGKINNAIAISGTYDTTIYMSKNNIYLAYHLTPNENKLFINFLKENSDKYFPKDTSNLINKVLSSEIFGDEAKSVEIKSILDVYFRTLSNEERINLLNRIDKDYNNYLENHWEELEKTGIIKIEIKPNNTDNSNSNDFEVKSGYVPGKLINQFAMDEYNGKLRVATTIGDYWKFKDKMTNNLYVLNDNLNIIGKLTNLEKGERIYAVRFMENKAYLITYKETDPLLVVDLENPVHPKLVGELKIPGYSTYLHPIGNDEIIALGMDDTRKLKISLYDVKNYSNPKELDKFVIDKYWSPALYNHHAFLWDSTKKILAIPVENHDYIFKILDNKIILKKDDVHNTSVLRSLYINNNLYTFSNDEIHIISEDNWKTINVININNYNYYGGHNNEYNEYNYNNNRTSNMVLNNNSSNNDLSGTSNGNIVIKYIKIGEKFNISLDENPTTGYSWSYTITNSKVLKIIDNGYTANNQNNNLIGSGGIHVWSIEGLKEGNSTIVFHYKRPWENNSIKTIEYVIYVNK